MIRDKLAYKTIQKMLDEIESGRQFAKGLRGRCFREASFEDLEKMTLGSEGGMWKSYGEASSKVVKLPLTRRYPMAIAASVSLLLVALYFSIRIFLPNEVITENGEYKVVELPDHSEINLNADSRIKYNPISWYWDRKVELEGEAFFLVEKGSDFTVNSSMGTVKVLGTSFNVLTRKNQFKVDCKTGTVEVKSGDSKLIINKDESVALNTLNGELEKSSGPDSYVATWRKGYFNFDSEKLENVIEELERQYDVKISLQSSEDHLFTGYFPINNLNSSLETVCSALGLKYRIREIGKDHREIIIQ